jgi:hypothetical protein
MRSRLLLPPGVLLLATSACMMQQLGSGPRPASVVLRVIAADSSVRLGGLVLADGDSLVLYDLKAKTRFVMREEPGVRLELYRGQGETGKAAAEGAGKGALLGAGLGALAGGLFGVVLGSDPWWGDVDVAGLIAAGALAGAVSGASSGAMDGAAQGKPTWERVTFRQLRQELCHCAEPTASRRPTGS